MALHDLTRDLHHACEAHPVGQRMVAGGITPKEWADWLWAFRTLHGIVDDALPAGMARDAQLATDLSLLPRPTPSRAALRLAMQLLGQDCTGAAYVLHGAHLSGGRVLAPKMAKRGLPSVHTVYADPETARAWLTAARARAACAEQARATFATLLSVMDEIHARPAD